MGAVALSLRQKPGQRSRAASRDPIYLLSSSPSTSGGGVGGGHCSSTVTVPTSLSPLMVTTEWRQNVGFLIHQLGLFSRQRAVSHCLGHFATGSPCLYTRVVGRMTRCLSDCSLCARLKGHASATLTSAWLMASSCVSLSIFSLFHRRPGPRAEPPVVIVDLSVSAVGSISVGFGDFAVLLHIYLRGVVCPLNSVTALSLRNVPKEEHSCPRATLSYAARATPESL